MSEEDKITIPVFKCAKCKHEWMPRKKAPKLCPNCRTAYWKEEDRDQFGKIKG